MRAIIIALVLLAGLAEARNGQRLFREMARTAVGGPAAPSITVDMWQDFEFDTITANNLNANDHTTNGTWSLSANQAPAGISTDDEMATISRVGGLSDAGTRGLRRYVTNAVTSYIAWSIPASTGIVFGFWFKPPYTPTSYSGGHKIIMAYNAGWIDYYQGSGSNSPVIRLGYGGSNGSGSSPLTPGSWYWITARLINNGPCTGIVYNASGVALATQPSQVTGLNNNITALFLGDANPNDTHPSFWAMDDVVADITALRYPLGP